MRRLLGGLVLLTVTWTVIAQTQKSALNRLLDSELSRFPAKAGRYVKHLKTGEEAGVRSDEAFNSFSVIKLSILAMAYNLSEQKRLSLDERVEIRRAVVRDGSGVFQFADYGLNPTIRDVLTQMV